MAPLTQGTGGSGSDIENGILYFKSCTDFTCWGGDTGERGQLYNDIFLHNMEISKYLLLTT